MEYTIIHTAGKRIKIQT